MSALESLARLLEPERHLFLSPHYDDTTLSCGGTVALLARHGRMPEVTVVFAAGADTGEALTDFAAFQHRQWGTESGEATALRQREEESAAALLGCRVRYLPFPDAIYRGTDTRTMLGSLGPPTADEADLPAAITDVLNLEPGMRSATRLYAPLALGGHVDHRLVRTAALALATDGWDVWFYEDQPYAVLGSGREQIEQVADLIPVATVDVSATWTTKIDAIWIYASQVRWIFRQVAPGGERDAIERALAAYARGVGDGRHGERFWRIGDPKPVRMKRV